MVKKLRVNQGTDEVNWEGNKYRVNNDGTVTVPDAAVEPLLKVGGLTLVEDEAPAVGRSLDEGSARLVRADGQPAGGVSWNGRSFSQQDDGSLIVPHAAVADLASHGLIVASDQVDADLAKAQAEAQKKHDDEEAARKKAADEEAKKAADEAAKKAADEAAKKVADDKAEADKAAKK